MSTASNEGFSAQAEAARSHECPGYVRAVRRGDPKFKRRLEKQNGADTWVVLCVHCREVLSEVPVDGS